MQSIYMVHCCSHAVLPVHVIPKADCQFRTSRSRGVSLNRRAASTVVADCALVPFGFASRYLKRP